MTVAGCITAGVAACSSGAGHTTATSRTAPAATRQAASAGRMVATSPIAGARGWLAYQTTDDGEDRVHLVRVDGSDDHAIGSEVPGRTAHPDFSPDGRHLVIDQLTSQDDVDQLYVGDADGTDLRLVARCRPPACLDHWEAAWSPDGRRLAVSIAGGRLTDAGPALFGLAVVDVAGQSVRPVLVHRNSAGQDHFARWSPDGATILFTTRPLLLFQGRGESELYVMDPDGTPACRSRTTATGDRAPPSRGGPATVRRSSTCEPKRAAPPRLAAIRPDGSDDAIVLDDREVYTHPCLQPAASGVRWVGT